jgi:nucleoside-diphosphate-sugar epimerase
MAAICGGIGANASSPADFTFLNTKMAINIFEMIRKYNIKYYYGLGSICSYPGDCPVPFKEDDMFNGFPEETNSGYGISKRMQYMLFKTHRKQYGLKGAFLVPVNLYGRHDHFDLKNSHVIPALINKFVHAVENNEESVSCWGTGEVSREFLFAEDCANAILKTLVNKIDYSEPINLGTGKDISIKELANLIAKLTNFKGNIVFSREMSDGQRKRLLNVQRAEKVLGWKAYTKFESGLNQTINWYIKNKGKL